MDMCYDGTLVMPSNCVVMDEEEMTYVEGGGTTALLAIASAGLLAPAGAAGTAYCSYVATQYTAAYNKCSLKQ